MPRLAGRCVAFAIAFALASLAMERGNAQVPSPEAFLGRPLGERFTPHHRIEAYVHEVARKSDRVTWKEYGRTYEDRPLLLLTVTSAANHERLESLRERLLLLRDPRRALEAPLEEWLVDLPVVVWLSYNVHGNEASPSETFLHVLHRLATAEDEATLRRLDETIVLLDPCVNPDGHERYVSWITSVQGAAADPDPQSMEHDEPWPGGRGNHELFDLNRDWAFATQIETRSRLKEFLAWSPQVHVDFHEMGYESTYFFFPAENPINHNLPEHTLEWGRVFGRGNADAFDARGITYYTGEAFDLFYPGYGDSWPSFTGAIGMTYEQGGHGRAGTAVRREDGQVLTLLDRLTHHAVASFATLETAARHREALLRSYRDFRQSAIDRGREGRVRAYLVPPGEDPSRTRAMIAALLAQGIEVERTLADATVERCVDSLGEERTFQTFERGTYVVDLAQPLGRLASTLLEARTKIKELSFYDVSAWSFPFVHGVLVHEVAALPNVEREGVLELEPLAGGVDREEEARVAYLLPYGTRSAIEALIACLNEGLVVRSAREEFTLGGREYPRGTLVVRRSENPSDLHATLARIGAETGVTFLCADSGFTEHGIDLGSSRVRRIVRPRVALLGGEGTWSSTFGATRFLIGRRLGVPHSVLPFASLARLDLDRYTALVLPSGNVPRAAHERLREFARQGGVVIAFGAAARSLCGGEEGGATRIALAKKGREDEGEKKEHLFLEELRAERQKEQIPGSILRVELDPAHPLSHGYRETVAVFQGSASAFDIGGPGVHVARFTKSPLLSGYAGERTLQGLEGQAYLSVEDVGRGAFVLFADDPNFRGAWHGLTRLFLNAALLLPERHVRD